ncbi:gamma carbonic anhydrase family protein [Flavobacterium chuncheonense]|uniref:Gamma carbonic anhydrase family protein n=1 Tax=Flavobacterium chuncheonense TaxID=2026653 RepID=A0ABW5YJ31_9FLAO
MKKQENNSYIHSSSFIYGNCKIDSKSSVWPLVVMRAEDHHILINEQTNIQDGTIIHVGYRHPVIIGKNCTVGHKVLIHGAIIGNDCVIGSGAMILDGAIIEDGCVVEAGAIIREGEIVKNTLGKQAFEQTIKNRFLSLMYYENAKAYAEGNYRLWSEPEFKKQQKKVLIEMMMEAKNQNEKSTF